MRVILRSSHESYVEAVHDELNNITFLSGHEDLTIAQLTPELEKCRVAGDDSKKQLAMATEQVENLRRDQSTFASRLAELRSHYHEQSRELVALCKELHSNTSSVGRHGRIIASLVTGVEEWTKDKQLAVAFNQVGNLKQDLYASASRVIGLECRCEKQSRGLVAVREELHSVTSSTESKVRTIASLATNIEEW